MERWQKKDHLSTVIEAVRLTEDNVAEVAAWCNASIVVEIDPEHPDEVQSGLNVMTMKGMERASLGMYVAKYGRHFFTAYPRFLETVYEPVNREAPPLESAGDSRKARGFADPFDMGRRQ